MIVAEERGSLRLVTQPDHAWLAGELLSLCRLPELLANPRRDALIAAVRLHDNGWRETDAAPPVNPVTGLPYSFTELPRELRLELWERGSARYADERPYAALLATEHALALHASREGEEGWRDLLPRLAERRDELLSRCGLRRDQLAADYRFLDLADAWSLAVCAGWGEVVERHEIRAERVGNELRLAPFPFAGASTLRVPCRRLPMRRWAGDAEFAGALATARWESLPVRVVSAEA